MFTGWKIHILTMFSSPRKHEYSIIYKTVVFIGELEDSIPKFI